MTTLETHPLRHLYTIEKARSKRISSWDRTGGNMDWIRIEAGETAVLGEIEGPGIITHLYCALAHFDPFDLRDAILRIYWEHEKHPSVEVPLGDFFCLPHCQVRTLKSALVTVNPGISGSHGFNAYFPMPFSEHALITLEHQGDAALGGPLGALWYHIDYEELTRLPANEIGRFHAQWRSETPTISMDQSAVNQQIWPGTNLDGDGNFVLVEAQGSGQVIGLHLQVDNIAKGWWGEGDDMWFIDGQPWPPAIHGTGTEEIFGGGACPTSEYTGPYTGFHQIEHLAGELWSGKSAMYRWFLNDPIRFERSITGSIEHGHANNFEIDYTSVTYWYQSEPHLPFPELASRMERRPRMPVEFDDLREALSNLTPRVLTRFPPGSAPFEKLIHRIGEIFDAMYSGHIELARELIDEMDSELD